MRKELSETSRRIQNIRERFRALMPRMSACAPENTDSQKGHTVKELKKPADSSFHKKQGDGIIRDLTKAKAHFANTRNLAADRASSTDK